MSEKLECFCLVIKCAVGPLTHSFRWMHRMGAFWYSTKSCEVPGLKPWEIYQGIFWGAGCWEIKKRKINFIHFPLCFVQILLYVSKSFWQVQYLNFICDCFWTKAISLNSPKKNFKRVYFFTKLSLLLTKNVCPLRFLLLSLPFPLHPSPSPFFFNYFQPSISIGITETAGRVSRLEWDSCSLFLKLLPWVSNMCSVVMEKKVASSLGGLVTDMQKEYSCHFSLRSELKII